MVTKVPKIDSDLTALAFAEELTFGVLGTPTWYPLEPNSYGPFGGELKNVARVPINSDRQRRAAVTVDLDAKAEFESDVTPSNLTRLLAGAFFANLRKKAVVENVTGSLLITAVANSTSTFTVVTANGSNFRANDLIKCRGFTNTGNNILTKVTSSTATTIVCNGTLVDETPPVGAKVTVVGHEFASGDAAIVVPAGGLPRLTTSSKDLTQLGVVPGEIVYIGGDAAGTSFAIAANNGYARVRSVSTNAMVFDKTFGTMVADAGTSKTIRIFLGTALKNETGSNIVRKSFQLERQLSYSDSELPGSIQSEYVTGAVLNTVEFTVKEADLLKAKFTFMGKDHEPRLNTDGIKSGTRAALISEDAFSTTSDLSLVRIAAYNGVTTNLSGLFLYVKDTTIKITNSVDALKAIGELGGFETSAGMFEVTVNLGGYFADTAAMKSVRANTPLTYEMHFGKDNQGISIDIPNMIAGKNLAEVKAKEAIMLPLDCDAASGYDIDPSLNHTMMMVFFDYLPTVADT